MTLIKLETLMIDRIIQKLNYWEIQLKSLMKICWKFFGMQKEEANQLFSKFIDKNYIDLVKSDSILFSHELLKRELFPTSIDNYFLIVIDNLRFDQWITIKPLIEELFRIEKEAIYSSIIPTTTQYAVVKFVIFKLTPIEIKNKYPNKWVDEEANEGKNLYEDFFLQENLRRNHTSFKSGYHKITNLNAGKKLVNQFNNLLQNKLTTIVYNFVDTLSHARTDMEVIKELAEDESAYRSITQVGLHILHYMK